MTYRGKDLGEFQLHVPGMHNILNATAAIAVGIGLDIDVEQIRTALDTFRGVDRRFQLRGKAGGVSVIDDSAITLRRFGLRWQRQNSVGFVRSTLSSNRTATPARAI